MYVARYKSLLEKRPYFGRKACARGVGDYPGQQCYDPNRPASLPYWIPDAAEAKCLLGTDAAQIYQQVVYGTPPTPAPPVLTPNVPTGALTNPSGPLDVDSTFNTPDQVSNWAQAITDQVNAAIADGSYNPNPSIPTATGGLGWIVLAVVLLGGGLYLAKR